MSVSVSAFESTVTINFCIRIGYSPLMDALPLSVSAFESTIVRWRTGMDWCQFRFVPGFSSVTRASAVVFGQMWNTLARAHRLVTALWLTADVIALHDRRHSFILHASFFLVRLHSCTSALNHAVYILFTFTTFIKKIRAIRSAKQEPSAESERLESVPTINYSVLCSRKSNSMKYITYHKWLARVRNSKDCGNNSMSY